MGIQPITLHAFREPVPGRRWRALFDATWPGYRAWWLSEGAAARPTAEESERALERCMPELVPVWRSLTQLTGDDPTAAAMLAQWNPPAFAPGCSQVVVTGPERALLRNYDYHPDLFEQVVLSTRWSGVDVLGTGDCLWGLLDGMNAHGLAVSLAYGGRSGVGEGFGIPLVVRYLLEVADRVDVAVDLLRRVPVSMAYNLTLSDATGRVRTVFVAPGRAPESRPVAVATNHRVDGPDDPAHAARFRSVERCDRLHELVARTSDPEVVARALQAAPLRSTRFAEGFGTLYTADYRPDRGLVHYRWPGTSWTRTFDSPDAELTVRLPVG